MNEILNTLIMDQGQRLVTGYFVSTWGRRILALSLIFGAHPSVALAQSYVRPFTVEVSASAGGTFDFPGATAYQGICQTGTTNCSQKLSLGKAVLPVLSGETAIALNRFVWLYGDYSYVLTDRQSAAAQLGAISGRDTANRHYWMAMGGVEFSFPNIHGVVPLVRIGGGEVHDSYNNYSVAPGTPQPIVNRFDARSIPSGTIGGGIRWYLGERQGVRIMANSFFLGHSIPYLAPTSAVSSQVPMGISFGTVAVVSDGAVGVTRRSGGDVTIGYFFQFGGRSRK